MRERFLLRLVIICLLVSLVSPPYTGLAYSSGSAPVKEFQGNAGLRTIDDRFAEVAQQVRGFGGLFYNESGQLTMYLTKGRLDEKEMVEATKASLVTIFKDDTRIAHAAEIRVIPGKYDFLQLKEWYDRMRIEVLSVPGVVLTDIDEMNNRVRVGVEDQEVLGIVEEQVSQLGVPREAVRIEVTGPFKPTDTVRDDRRPLVGGLQISYFKSNDPLSLKRCTLGLIAVRSGVKGMVVNSHCTKIQGGVEKTVYHQAWPALQGANRIAIETLDPGYFADGICPGGRLCRFSDTAFAKIPHPAGTTVTASRGYIARTTALGSLTIDPANPRFRIIGESPYPIVGEILNKVGRSTGWTQGKVSTTCADTISDSGLVLLCQDIADAKTFDGDSGAPVFRIRNSSPVHSAVDISATTGWHRTSLTLQRGKQFRISYNSGTWSVDYQLYPYVGPEGHPPDSIPTGCEIDATWPYGRLLGKIGIDGQIFSVGRGGTFTANANGNLYLRINDQNHCLVDNDGSVSMTLRNIRPTNAVYLYGILWGGIEDDTKFVFSAMSNIQISEELGELETCSPNYSC